MPDAKTGIPDYSMVRQSVRTRVQSNNEKALTALVKQLRSPLGVIPFLGAGISAKLYRQWRDFLSGTAREQLSPADQTAVEEALTKEDYLRAAGLIAKSLGERDFQRTVAEEFSDDRLRNADLSSGTPGLLPWLAAGPVITTNFDRVTEHVFEKATRRFEDRVYGANPDEVISAIQQNRLVLWKIHGDRSDSRNLVLSDEQYQKHYMELPELLLVAFLNRPNLFIGCSLDRDRTTEVLKSVRAQHPGSNHYGFVPIPETDELFDNRVAELRSMGVRPIWYRPGEHGEISSHLSNVLHAASSVLQPDAQRPAPQDTPKLTAEQADWRRSQEFEELAMSARFAPPEVRNYTEETPPYAPIVDKMTRGQIAFFLGAGACMGRLPLGREFYNRLIAHFRDSDALDSVEKYGDLEPPQIAQHFADNYDRDALYAHVNGQLAQTRAEPTVIHWFIATLRERLSNNGFKPSQQWIVTTNYDDWMEYSLRLTGQRYHLFTYRVSPPHAGFFVYQAPDGEVHVIDRPSHFHRLTDDHHTVLVKLHGGLHQNIDLPISYVFTHRDFVELAGQVPAAIPRVILERLTDKSLLFLGSGLGDDSIESIVRGLRVLHPKKASWAIQWQPRAGKRIYWQPLGVHIVDITLQTFMLELDRRLGSANPVKAASR